ncbi:MAG: type III secretion system stator protein SctL [Puniceicoccales bacterium]|nr:type III secretion system stator protein SctL [Puniceicoccales bacterium]
MAPGKHILRAGEFLALRGTADLIRDAEAIAKDIIREAQAAAAKLDAAAKARAKELADSTQAAFEKKKKEGYDVGLAEGKREMAMQMMEITGKNVQSFAAYSDFVLNMVMRAMRRVIGEIPNTELVHRIISNSLHLLRGQRQAVLRVNPEQASAARASIAELTKESDLLQTMVEVVADGRLEKNACLIETEVGVMDASLEVQLEAIRKVLEKTLGAS